MQVFLRLDDDNPEYITCVCVANIGSLHLTLEWIDISGNPLLHLHDNDTCSLASTPG